MSDLAVKAAFAEWPALPRAPQSTESVHALAQAVAMTRHETTYRSTSLGENRVDRSNVPGETLLRDAPYHRLTTFAYAAREVEFA